MAAPGAGAREWGSRLLVPEKRGSMGGRAPRRLLAAAPCPSSVGGGIPFAEGVSRDAMHALPRDALEGVCWGHSRCRRTCHAKRRRTGSVGLRSFL